jgi:diaminohydroxyphosphoribosylaminopyrimidine deaminase / 5-amino-6-(5-phosphoribosylamino)uracil reductase
LAPPCCDAIIEAKIARVVCCTLDPNPEVSGKGVKKLRQAGIKVEVGALVEEAETLNEVFFTFQKKRRPFVALKFAASLDGKIATRLFDSEWISNEAARKFSRNLRGRYPSILVGANTVTRDDPNLGLRKKGRPDPLRIILDSALKIPLTSQVLRDDNLLIVAGKNRNLKKYQRLLKQGVNVFVCPGKRIDLTVLMKELARRQITGVFVEGGGAVLGSFADEKLVDKVYAVHAPIIIGGLGAVSAIGGKGSATVKSALHLTKVSFKKFGDNIVTIGYPR